MHTDWLIVDGYSLLHRDDDARACFPHDLFMARHRLITTVAGSPFAAAGRVTIVFDGNREGGISEEGLSVGVEVLFAPGHRSADEIIERLVGQSREPEKILVVTSDRLERDVVSSRGAQTMSCGLFLRQCQSSARARPGRLRSRNRRCPPGSLGEFFPQG